MKFYNPFKWHIVKSGDYYFIRRYTLLGKEYLDSDLFVWFSKYKWKYGKFNSKEAAEYVLSVNRELVEYEV